MKNIIKLLVLVSLISLFSCSKEDDKKDSSIATTEYSSDIWVSISNRVKISNTEWSGSQAGFNYIIIVGLDTTFKSCTSVGVGSSFSIKDNRSLKVQATSNDTSTYISISVDNGSVKVISKAKYSAESLYSTM